MASISKKSLSCVSCKLYEDVESPKMQPFGDFEKEIMLIGEAPGQVEDRRGKPWQGKTGRLLQHTLRKLGVDLFRDCVSVNAVNCRPPNNRAPSPFEIDCCRAVIVGKAIKEYKPKVIILLGTVALQSFLSPRWKTDLGGITKWRGFSIPDQDYRCWVIPAFHPSFVARMESREANTIWEQDLGLVREAMHFSRPTNKEPDIHIIKDLSVLNSLRDASEIAIDYETTGLKPHRKGHRIVCVGVAANEDEVFAFMMPKTKEERRPFTDLLKSLNVGKMGHNIKYEHSWTLVRYGVEIQNWQWDSMLASHHLDNRAAVTGLKFQTYVNFGVIIKDEDVSKYIYEKQKSGNGFNKIFELLEQLGGEENLLRHVALDAHYEYRLAKKQMKQLGYDYLPF